MKKNFKLILALILALTLVMGMAVAANAVSITINRDSTYSGTGDGNAYTYYKIFDATYAANSGTTGGGYDASGTGLALNYPDVAVSYTASKTLGDKIIAVNSGNQWFELTAIAGGSNDKYYSVKWIGDEDATRVQAAAEWLIAKGIYEGTPTTIPFNSGSSNWTVDNLTPGYYVISGLAGNNLIAATTDITINEKNSYPPLDKTQADEDYTEQSDAKRDVAVGDVLTYEVKVTIPKTVKLNDTILVWDKKTDGLTYNNDVAVKTGTNTGGAGISDGSYTDAVWAKVITITNPAAQAGTEVIFTCTMTVNSAALVDTGRKNEAGLKYGNSGTYKYDSLPDEVEYTTYYAGIHKYDGDNSGTDLSGVKFTLEETFSGTASPFTVTKSGTYYYYDASGSSQVETDDNGMIIIRGLDEDKTYTLTETETNAGYNLLSGSFTLTLYEDKSGTTPDAAKTSSIWTQVPNYKGTVLPSTGGIGTTIFYIGGSILVLAAAILLITKRRMSNND